MRKTRRSKGEQPTTARATPRKRGVNPRALGTNPRAMSERAPDLAWEALVRSTHANPAFERGALNSALRAIRSAALTEGLHEDSLPAEIERRSEAYARTFPGMTLTPNALAKHWFRVIAVPVPILSPQQAAIEELRRQQ